MTRSAALKGRRRAYQRERMRFDEVPVYDAHRLRAGNVIPVGHCPGGPGPNTFDAVAALEQWVEKGVAPSRLIATKSTNGKVERTRPLCPYPQEARYKGTGSIDDAANFACVAPPGVAQPAGP